MRWHTRAKLLLGVKHSTGKGNIADPFVSDIAPIAANKSYFGQDCWRCYAKVIKRLMSLL